MQSSAQSSRGRVGGDGRSTAKGEDGFGPSGSTRRRRKRSMLHVVPLLVVLFVVTSLASRILPLSRRRLAVATPSHASAFLVPTPEVGWSTRDRRRRTLTWPALASVRGDGRWGPSPKLLSVASPLSHRGAPSSRHPHLPSPPIKRALVTRWLSAPSTSGAVAATTDKCSNVTVNASSLAGDGTPVLVEVDAGKKNGITSPTVLENVHPPGANGETSPTSRGSKSGEGIAGTDNCTVVAAAISGNSTSEAAANSTGAAAVTAISSSTTTTRIRTANGGYLHTMESRTRISIANKGKIPWNKGRTRTPEERARISAGVRERNRLRLEAECRANGTTIEEYMARKEEDERRRKRDRAARRTARGGYTPTDETRAKISAVLKEKWASGDVKTLKRKKMAATNSVVASVADFNSTDKGGNVTPVGGERAPASASAPRGPHSEETKEKIRVALKAKWSEDAEYRRAMTAKAHAHSNSTDVRRRISETLKARWRDPEFRATMMNKIANRKSQVGRVTDEAHRRKISETMRAKWRDPGYRRKALDGMAKKRSEMGITSSSTSSGAVRSRSRSARKLDAAARGDGASGLVRPVRPRAVRKKRALKAKVETEAFPNGVSTPTTKRTRTAPTKKRKLTTSPKKAVVAKRRAEPSPSPEPSSATTPSLTEEEMRVERMREERKDLYDLLYGSENEDEVLDEQLHAYSSSILDEDDEDFDVDNYDPYGLDRLEQSRSV